MLTPKQSVMLDYIKSHMLVKVVPPTVRELADHFEIQINAVRGYVKILKDKGYLRTDTHKIVPTGARITFASME